MNQAAKLGLPAAAAALLGAGAVALLGGDPRPGPERADPPAFRLAGVNLAAARGCAEVPGCTVDAWAQSPDGGVIRLVVRAADGGHFQYPDGGDAFTLELDGGAGDLFPRP